MVGPKLEQVGSTYLLNNNTISLILWWLLGCVIVTLVATVKWTSRRAHQFEQVVEPGSGSSDQHNTYHRWKAKLLLKMVAKTTLVLLAFGIVISIFAAFFVSKINTDKDANNLFVAKPDLISNDHAVTLDDRFENLFWFIQISDTHFSYYNDRNRKVDLQDFCRQMIPLIKPPVLVLSGDITDSRSPDPMGSDQYIKEWLAYNETRIMCMNANPGIHWLDIRGNHDNFNVYNSRNSFYKNFTIQGNLTKEGRSYRYEVKAQDGNHYSFIAVDACLKPGIRRPFNFIGRLDSEELERVNRLKQESVNSTYTVWFGHYPTSSIANADDIRSIISGPYLCGHYHNFHGIAPQMYSTQPQGYLEAELGDWKANRMFRIGVIDGGLFTFSDFSYKRHHNEDAPLIVISNPRSILYQMELSEPFWRSARSTHIRALIFSKRPLIHVNACITSQPKMNHNCLESFELKHVKGPLWVVPWSTKKYQKGLYYITVTASNDHETQELTSPFSFDQTKPQFSMTGRISLRISFQSMGLYLFVWALIIALVPLSIFKIFTFSDNAYFRHMFNLSRRSYFRKLIFKLYILAHINKLFYPLILIPIYLCVGPWFVGNFVADSIGVVFMWGTFIEGYLLPVSFTYIFSAIFLIIFHIPFIVSMACLAGSRCMKIMSEVQLSNLANGDSSENNEPLKVNYCDLDYLKIAFIIFIIFLEGCFSTMFFFAYGFIAMLTNVYAWLTLLYVIILGSALKLTKEDLKKWL